MVRKHSNVLVIMSDEHNAGFLGCAGHPLVRTPCLDALAASGTRFVNAVTNSPICVPARASFATGRYVHEIGAWDNAHAYDGRVPGWGRRLQQNGIRVDSIGKLHYRNEADPTGFDRQIEPMHISKSGGQVWGSLREPLPTLSGPQMMYRAIGPGESGYNRYDRRIVDHAAAWLAQEAASGPQRPWALFVGLVAPHFPLVVPQRYFDMYAGADIRRPRLHPDDGYVRHPWVQAMDDFFHIDREFDDTTRRRALAAYMGLCTFLDDCVGELLRALAATGLDRTTTVIYTSDHGDNAGVRGLWGKCNMYAESIAVPLIVAGPGVPAGRVCKTPASLVDIAATITDCLGLDADPAQRGASLLGLVESGDDAARLVFSEYHAIGSVSASYMVQDARWKYIHYVGMRPELFRLDDDPGEERDLAGDARHADTLESYARRLRAICDPGGTDRRAKADQAKLIARHGGREAVLNSIELGADAVPGGHTE